MQEVEKLYEMLRKTQESRGYYFNKDRDKVFELPEGLLVNKSRYGYMSCPCRLASGEREKDTDIICPYEYRSQKATSPPWSSQRRNEPLLCQMFMDLPWGQFGEILAVLLNPYSFPLEQINLLAQHPQHLRRSCKDHCLGILF